MKSTKVKAYTYKRKGKTIHVKAHSRNLRSSKLQGFTPYFKGMLSSDVRGKPVLQRLSEGEVFVEFPGRGYDTYPKKWYDENKSTFAKHFAYIEDNGKIKKYK